jgi:hypothetical protein
VAALASGPGRKGLTFIYLPPSRMYSKKKIQGIANSSSAVSSFHLRPSYTKKKNVFWGPQQGFINGADSL